MPDEKGKDLTDEEEVPRTSLHAHDEGREDDVEGDPDPDSGEDRDPDEGGPGNPVSDEEE